MKQAIGYFVLIVLLVALVGILFATKRSAAVRQKQDVAAVLSFSNSLKEASVKLDDARGVISNLEKDVAERNAALELLTNDLTRTVGTLAQTKAELEAARKKSEAELAQRDARITDLEAQNLNLDRRAAALTNALAELNTQIAETRRRMASAEGDKAFLEGELKRLMSEKADLEKKFNDLAVLRDQVKKLKDDLVVSRRLDWVRKGIYSNADRKGAEMLLFKSTPPKPQPAGVKHDLNVEIGSDGSVRVVPPTPKPATNAPPR